MSAAIEAQLRLDIAQFQAELQKGRDDMRKWVNDLKREGRSGATALNPVSDAHKELQRVMSNPWVTAGVNAKDYLGKLQSVEKEAQRIALAHAKLASYKGPQTAAVNPWVTAGSAQFAAQQREAERVAARNAALDSFKGRSGESLDTNRILAMQAIQSRSMSGRGGKSGNNFQLGNMAMQLQDIAVQLQSGTSAAVVFTQQGSQMLSMFGAGGAIIGGAAAVGGAMVTMAQGAGQAFKDFTAHASRAHQTMQELRVSITADNIASGLKVAREEISKLKEEASKVTGFGAEMGTNLRRMARAVGLPGFANEKSQEEKNKAVNDQLIEAERERGALIAAGLAASAQEVEIARLRGQGLTKEADELQHKLEVARELAKIEADANLPRRAKDQLKADLITKDAAAQAAAGFDKETKTKEEIARIQAKLKEDTLSTLEPHEKFVELAKEQEKIFASMAEKGGLFYEQSIAGLEAWAEALAKMGKTEKQLEVLKMLEEARALEARKRAAAEEAAGAREMRDREADAKRDGIEKVKQKMSDEQDRFAEKYKSQQQAKKDLADELKLAAAKARGDTGLVARMERELSIREKTQQIIAATNLDEKTARIAASQLVSDTSSGPLNAEERRRGHIRGVQRRIMMESGLDEFHRNQVRDGTAATALGAHSLSRGSGPLSGRGTSAIRSRLMGGGDGGSLTSRAAQPLASHSEDNAHRAAASSDGSRDINQKILEVLVRGLLGS